MFSSLSLLLFGLSCCGGDLMANSRKGPSTLNLTTTIPGSSSSSSKSVQREGNSGHNMRDIDINQPAPEAEEELPIGGMDDMVTEGNNLTKPKKLRLSPEKTWFLEEAFNRNPTLDSTEREELATKLDLLPRQVAVWYQNHKARTKAKKKEMENVYMKRQCRLLIDENMRLRQEIERLRALKMAPSMPSASTTNLQQKPPSTK